MGANTENSRMDNGQRKRVAEVITQRQVSAIIRTNDRELASDAMKAAVDGGIRMVEFTLTTPGALDLVTKFRENQDLLVGAGTVLTVQQATDAVAAGAQFLVSPIADEAVIAEAARRQVPSIPGACTPTEMQAAHLWGADFVKVFPAVTGGVSFIQAVLGPLPHLKLFPTAGVTIEDFTHFLDAGCVGVGFVRPLFDPDDMRRRDFGAIHRRACEIMRRLAERGDRH